MYVHTLLEYKGTLAVHMLMALLSVMVAMISSVQRIMKSYLETLLAYTRDNIIEARDIDICKKNIVYCCHFRTNVFKRLSLLVFAVVFLFRHTNDP